MTEIKYDPEFPYVVLFGDYVAAKFPADRNGKANAKHYASGAAGTFVDTTPKPKIPEDAEFIIWDDPYDNGEERIARRYGHPANKVWRVGVDTLDELDLLNDWIGDAEVTVLVRKEDS